MQQPRGTALGYRTCRCRARRRVFNERTGTPFNHRHVPTDIALLVVLWRLRHTLRLRDVAEMFLTRGFTFTHETVWEWEARFASLVTTRLRAKRRGTAGTRWHVGETYLEVDGQWYSLCRAIDRDGTRVEALLSEQRDRAAVQRFFAHALDAAGHASAQVTTAGYDADSRAIREALGKDVTHRTSRDKNNRIAQDHRGIKQRYSPLCGFGRFASAARCGTGFAEQRQYCRLPTNRDERVVLAAQRRFQDRWAAVRAELVAA